MGDNNQTFSARNWEWKRRNKINVVYLLDKIFFWDTDHCLNAWIKWEIINHAIRTYDKKMDFDYYRDRHNWYEK